MSIVDNQRPPYVTFERRPVEDRMASAASGCYRTKDVDFVIVTRPGSRDTVEKEAEVWLREIAERAKPQRGQPPQIPPEWPAAFRSAYERWKNNEEEPVNGTPIKGWPVLSPSAQRDLLQAGVRTVEDLAALPEPELSRVGIGAVAFKQKAVAWLAAANDTGKAAAQIEALTEKVAQLVALTTAQADEIKLLRLQVTTPEKA